MNYWGLILKIIVSILGLFFVGIEFEFFLRKAKKRKRRKIITLIFAALIVFTVWDTTNDYVNNDIERLERDSSITKDSIRIARIIDDINTNLTKIEGVSGQVLSSYNEIIEVKEGVQVQQIILEDIKQTTGKNLLQNSETHDANAAKISISSTNAHFDNDGYLNINLTFKNFGVRTATNIKYFYQVVYSQSVDNNPNSHSGFLMGDKDSNLNYYPKQWRNTPKGQDFLPTGNRARGSLSITPKITSALFKSKYDLWVVILSFKYNDGYTSKIITETTTISGDGYNDGKFRITNDNVNLDALDDIFKKDSIRKFIF